MTESRDQLHNQLIKLGDMMGDGLHHDPDGKWISKEYKKVMKALGMLPKRKSHVTTINEAMAKRLENLSCPTCGRGMKQTRSGSMRAECMECGAKFQVLKRG